MTCWPAVRQSMPAHACSNALAQRALTFWRSRDGPETQISIPWWAIRISDG